MRTLDFPGLPDLLHAAFGALDARVDVVSLGVAGPIRDGVAVLALYTERVKSRIFRRRLGACLRGALAFVEHDRGHVGLRDEQLASALGARSGKGKGVLLLQRACDTARSVAP